MSKRLVLVTLLGCAACSPTVGAGGGPDAAPPIDAPPPFMEALPGSIPHLVDVGGAVLATPKVQAIFFANDATVQAQIDDFETQLAGSTYWSTAGSEYGVGAVTKLPTIVVTDTPPTTGAGITALLDKHLTGAGADWTYDPNTIYSVFTPDGVVVSDADGTSCQDYDAYHDEDTTTAGKPILYAFMPRCTGQGPVLDELTESASHEWLEAATDPHVQTTPAYGDADPDNYIWAYTPGAEVGDYCEYLDSAYQQLVGSYKVQRTWSNASAMAGHDPCVPVLTAPYASAAPIMADTVTINDGQSQTMTKGVKVALGQSVTIPVQLYSDAPMADFTVDAIDIDSMFSGGSPELTFTWDKTTGHNGDTLHLTITRKANGTQLAGSEFAIETKVAGAATNLWWAFAAN